MPGGMYAPAPMCACSSLARRAYMNRAIYTSVEAPAVTTAAAAAPANRFYALGRAATMTCGGGGTKYILYIRACKPAAAATRLLVRTRARLRSSVCSSLPAPHPTRTPAAAVVPCLPAAPSARRRPRQSSLAVGTSRYAPPLTTYIRCVRARLRHHCPSAVLQTFRLFFFCSPRIYAYT